MLRSFLYGTGALLLCTGALAQTPAPSTKILPVPKAAKDAGVYHVATGKWTRGATANIGTDVLYDNTCTTGFYIGLSPGETLVESGRLPGPTSPTSLTSLTGTANTYTIDGFQIAYCTFVQGTTSITMSWYNAYSPCSDASVLTPDAAFSISGLPGDLTGSGSCWIVTIDLAGGTGTSLAFTLTADQDTVWDGSDTLDNFGWAFLENSTSTLGNGGPLLAGDPLGITTGTACPWGEGTAWAAVPNSGNPGTGLGSDDVFETDQAGMMAGCWFFGGYFSGNPYADFYIQMLGDAAATPTEPGTAYCNADGVNQQCPCGNNNDGSEGIAGCANNAGNVVNPAGGATLRATGVASISNDTVVLKGANLQFGQPGLYFQANNAINSGNGVPFGDGLRCAGGGVVRLQIRVAGSASSATPGESETTVPIGATATAGATLRYQLWYRNPGVSPCGAGFNFTNGYEITWAP